MLGAALQRNAKHEARLLNISGYFDSKARVQKKSEIESLASQTSSAALQLRFAQNDSTQAIFCHVERSETSLICFCLHAQPRLLGVPTNEQTLHHVVHRNHK